MRTDCPVHKQSLPCGICIEVDQARAKLGLPHDRFADVGGGIGPGCRIACRCIHCGNLFVSRSHNLADVEFVCKGECGCTDSQWTAAEIAKMKAAGAGAEPYVLNRIAAVDSPGYKADQRARNNRARNAVEAIAKAIPKS